MRVEVAYPSGHLEFDVPDDRVVGVWGGPPAVAEGRVRGLVLDALESPSGYPSLRQAVVPGDRVAIALDPSTPERAEVLGAACDVLTEQGVEPGSIRIVAPLPAPEGWSFGLPGGVEWHSHDPEDRASIAYLAATPQGRRIYLNRQVTDADFVLAVGPFGFDSVLGFRGPWSAIFPDLSDAETLRAYRAQSKAGNRERWDERTTLVESAAVSWLLGAQLQVGLLAAATGLAAVVAGAEAEVQAEGHRLLESAWTFHPERRADLVVVGIGCPWRETRFDDLADGLATAARLLRRGGKIVALTDLAGEPGPALSRLVGLDDPGDAPAALRGSEGEPDYPAARRIARVLARARVYLSSNLAEDRVEDLGMVALGEPREARRLADAAGSCLFVNRADATRVVVGEDE